MSTLINPYSFNTNSSISLVGYSIGTNPGTTDMLLPSGSAAGDACAFLYVTTNGSGGWASRSYGLSAGMQSSSHSAAMQGKILTSTDISDGYIPQNSSTGRYIVVVYRGVTSIALANYAVPDIDPDTALGIPTNQYDKSFTKGGSSKKLVGLWINQPATSTLTSYPWINQHSAAGYGLHDSDSSNYTNGSTISTIWGGSANVYSAWSLVELS